MNFVSGMLICVLELMKVCVLYTTLVCYAFVLHYIVRIDP